MGKWRTVGIDCHVKRCVTLKLKVKRSRWKVRDNVFRLIDPKNVRNKKKMTVLSLVEGEIAKVT